MRKVTKAVFPVAGLGTRFLPATKAMPKELLPIIDKPIIQYAVEEAIAAGIKDLIFVTGRTKCQRQSKIGPKGSAKCCHIEGGVMRVQP